VQDLLLLRKLLHQLARPCLLTTRAAPISARLGDVPHSAK
jgi:hypothetical protein